MILRNQLLPIGTAVKTHGLRGELSVLLSDNAPDTDALNHVVLCVDGIFVPFRIAAQRPRGTQGILLTLDGVDSADEAAQYTGLEIFALLAELPDDYADIDSEEGIYAEDLEGFTLTAADGSQLGTIEAVDTTTLNTLLDVRLDEGHSALVPLAEDWIISVDANTRTIAMDIPQQLLNQSI